MHKSRQLGCGQFAALHIGVASPMNHVLLPFCHFFCRVIVPSISCGIKYPINEFYAKHFVLLYVTSAVRHLRHSLCSAPSPAFSASMRRLLFILLINSNQAHTHMGSEASGYAYHKNEQNCTQRKEPPPKWYATWRINLAKRCQVANDIAGRITVRRPLAISPTSNEKCTMIVFWHIILDTRHTHSLTHRAQRISTGV